MDTGSGPGTASSPTSVFCKPEYLAVNAAAVSRFGTTTNANSFEGVRHEETAALAVGGIRRVDGGNWRRQLAVGLHHGGRAFLNDDGETLAR